MAVEPQHVGELPCPDQRSGEAERIGRSGRWNLRKVRRGPRFRQQFGSRSVAECKDCGFLIADCGFEANPQSSELDLVKRN